MCFFTIQSLGHNIEFTEYSCQESTTLDREGGSFVPIQLSRWAKVNLNSNWTDPLYRPYWRVASTGPSLS